ncbi:hypothetical protein CPC08DRAFT_422755 [Agrocybe pediades]|nr:hypothetical protein CPC08DRAFT_422755 [Agrocybe pediades]
MPFRHRAVQILFHHVEITNDLPESGSQSLVLLRQIVTPPNPSLEGVARNIESVSISYKLPPRQRWPLPCQDHLHDLHEFLGHQDLIAVINALHREAVRIKRLVIDLAISGFQQQSRGTQWDKIDPRFRSALQDLARSPYLRYFRISDVHHVPLALLSDANFQSLRLRNSVFDQQDDYTHDLHTGGESYYPTLEAVFDHDGTASQQKLQLQRAPNELPSFQRLKKNRLH